MWIARQPAVDERNQCEIDTGSCVRPSTSHLLTVIHIIISRCFGAQYGTYHILLCVWYEESPPRRKSLHHDIILSLFLVVGCCTTIPYTRPTAVRIKIELATNAPPNCVPWIVVHAMKVDGDDDNSKHGERQLSKETSKSPAIQQRHHNHLLGVWRKRKRRRRKKRLSV